MAISLKSIGLAIFAPFVLADEEQKWAAVHTYSDKNADEEIRSFMVERWGKQVWQIEARSSGEDANGIAWYVKGTIWRVRLEPAWHFSLSPEVKPPDLADLDRNHRYQFVGNPVDQAYGVVVFYVTSIPERIAGEEQSKAEQGGAEEPATRAESELEGGDKPQPESEGRSR